MSARVTSLRLIVAAAAACTVGVITAAPASAHDGGPGGTNFKSDVVDVPVDGVRWEVPVGDALVAARNDTDRELVVLGYQGEPFLRFVPGEGVFENRRSPATYLNADRFAEVAVPAEADPEAPPTWERVATGSSHAWHDHRIHWMSRTDPPAVQADPGRGHTIFDWQIPFELEGEDEQQVVRGTLRWLPSRPWWPWVLGALIVAAVPLALGSRTHPEGHRWPGVARPVLVLLAVVLAAGAVHAVDDLATVPGTLSDDVVPGTIAAVVLAVGGWCVWRGWRADGTGLAAVAIGSLVVLFGQGLPHRSALGAPVLASSLPDGFTRGLVAMSLALAVPGIVVGLLAERRFGTFFGRPEARAGSGRERAQ